MPDGVVDINVAHLFDFYYLGLGREGADYSLDFYTESKTICLAN